MELLNGNIEGVVCSKIVATSYMNIYPGLAFSEVPVESNKNGVGVAVAKGDENATLLAAVNETVERVVADGTYDGWSRKGLRAECRAAQGTGRGAVSAKSSSVRAVRRKPGRLFSRLWG